MTEEMKQLALTKAINMLTGLGVVYEVRDGETIYGGLPKDDEQKRYRTKRRDYTALNIKERLRAMQPGSVEQFDPAVVGVRACDLQGCITGHSYAIFGSGNYITTAKAGVVEVMRIA